MSKPDKKMHFLVIGCGSIGKRHIRNLKKLGYKVSGCESNIQKANSIKRIYKIDVFRNLKEAFLNKYTAAFICTPTSLHMSLAIEAAKRGMDLFIEKPLSHNLKEIENLRMLIRKKRLIALVGCNTRFSPLLKTARGLIVAGKIGKVLSVRIECGFHLPCWHPYEDYTKGYSANRSLGGGVILDDIHELDSLYWLFGSVRELFCYADKISNLKIDTEDIAEIFLKFNSGVLAQIHLDYLQRTYRRVYEFIGEKGVILVDFMARKAELHTGRKNPQRVFKENKYSAREKMFIEEIKHFVRCVKNRQNTINDIEGAKRILEIAMACKESARKKEVISL